MQARKPIKKIFVRFFTMSQLFVDGYSVTEGDGIPRNFDIPDMEVKSRKLSDMDFFIPESAIGFVFYEIITSQVEDNGQIVEVTSGEINKSGRHFFSIRTRFRSRCNARRSAGGIRPAYLYAPLSPCAVAGKNYPVHRRTLF